MKTSLLSKNLLKWYQENARDLPWRKTTDPYKIWVSEIMLQQTQVNTVIPYYRKWMKAFPTLKSLAEAPLDKAMNYWAGLGYYRRVRMLHQGAQLLAKENQGKLPTTVTELMAIPGIGRYTAGAIASIAFGQKAPILDGNVIRILTRIFALKQDVSDSKTIKKLWHLAEEILPNKNLGDFNQAMMELGATVCMPDNPKCSFCPVKTKCKAFEQTKQTFYPVNKKKPKIEKIKRAALILENKGTFLIEKQPASGRWGNLWMFPHCDSKKEMVERMRLKTKNLRKFTTIRHGFTKYQVDLEVFHCQSSRKKINSRQKKWIRLSNLKDYPLPSPHKKILKELIKHESS